MLALSLQNHPKPPTCRHAVTAGPVAGYMTRILVRGGCSWPCPQAFLSAPDNVECAPDIKMLVLASNVIHLHEDISCYLKTGRDL